MLELGDEEAVDLYYATQEAFYTEVLHANRIKQLINLNPNASNNEILNLLSDLEESIANAARMLHNSMSTQYGDKKLQELENEAADAVGVHCNESNFAGGYSEHDSKDELPTNSSPSGERTPSSSNEPPTPNCGGGGKKQKKTKKSTGSIPPSALSIAPRVGRSNEAAAAVEDHYISEHDSEDELPTNSSPSVERPPSLSNEPPASLLLDSRGTIEDLFEHSSSATNRIIMDRDTLLADSRGTIEDLSERISTHRVVAVNLRLAEIVISQVEHAYKNSDLSSIPLLAKNLVVVLQSNSKYKKMMEEAKYFFSIKRKASDVDCYADLNANTSSIGSMLKTMDDAVKAKEQASNKKLPTTLIESLALVKEAFHRLKVGDNGDVSDLLEMTKNDVNAMKKLLPYDRAVNNLVLNLLHECMMVNLEKNVSMYLLLTFETTKDTTAEQIAKDLKNLALVTELWKLVKPNVVFDAKVICMFEYRQTVLFPGLRSKDTEKLAIKVLRLMSILLTDTKRKGRDAILIKFDEAQKMNLDGTGTTCTIKYCNARDKQHSERRTKMAILRHNLSAAENIEGCLPDSLCPHGFTHELLVNAPSNIKRGCNFTDKKVDVFDVDGVHQEESEIVKRMKSKLNTHEIGEMTILTDNEPQVECLTDLLKS